MQKLVSIIVPAYNVEAYIAETIESVIVQTYTNWELIIVDDGSTDGTADIVKQYALTDPRIQYHYQTNGRQGKARNTAIKHANGELLAFLDADDLWPPNKLETQIEIFDLFPVDFVYTNGVVFQGNINQVVSTFTIPEGLQDESFIFEKLLNGYSFPNLSVMVKTKNLRDIEGFEEDLRIQNAEDYQMWLRLADNSCVMYGLNKPLFYYRKHPNQVTASDGLAIVQALWALRLSKLNKINENQKSKVLLKRLNKYFVHYIDSMEPNRIKEILSLYKQPIGSLKWYYINSFLILLGKTWFKKYHYKYTDLTI